MNAVITVVSLSKELLGNYVANQKARICFISKLPPFILKTTFHICIHSGKFQEL